MDSAWLREYVLETLGTEIRKTATLTPAVKEKINLEDPNGVLDPFTPTVCTDRSRLVQITARGQGDGNETEDHIHNNHGWWNLRRRGTCPNLTKHQNAWLRISDGSHSLLVFFTIGALKQIFDWDNRNQSGGGENSLFGFGSCLLLKEYSLESVRDGGPSPKTCLHLKVSSLEPKPGFNNHFGNVSSKNRTIIPLSEDVACIYGLQYLHQQRKLSKGRDSNHPPGDARSLGAVGRIVRDWEISFGRLSKGLWTAPTRHGPIQTDGAIDTILKLSYTAESTEDAIRDWEKAKGDFGIHEDTFHLEKPIDTHSDVPSNEKSGEGVMDRQEKVESDTEEDEVEDQSRLFIQNVLATQDDTQEDTIRNRETKRQVSGTEDANRTGDNAVIRISGIERKRPRSNSFESGTPSNLTIDETIGENELVVRSSWKSLQKRRRKILRLQCQGEHRQAQQQSKATHNTSIWESIKEQLFEPGRTVIDCIPSFGSSTNPQSVNSFHTPSNRSTTRTRSPAFSFTSLPSVGTASISTATPNPSSGAYYRKYGLARWLNQNTVFEDEDNHRKSAFKHQQESDSPPRRKIVDYSPTRDDSDDDSCSVVV